jgi:hypothetical protein
MLHAVGRGDQHAPRLQHTPEFARRGYHIRNVVQHVIGERARAGRGANRQRNDVGGAELQPFAARDADDHPVRQVDGQQAVHPPLEMPFVRTVARARVDNDVEAFGRHMVGDPADEIFPRLAVSVDRLPRREVVGIRVRLVEESLPVGGLRGYVTFF